MNVGIPKISRRTCSGRIHAIPHLCVWNHYGVIRIPSNYIGVNISHKKLCIFMELKSILMRVLITSHMCLFSWLVLADDHNFQALWREKCPRTALLLWSTGDSSPED